MLLEEREEHLAAEEWHDLLHFVHHLVIFLERLFALLDLLASHDVACELAGGRHDNRICTLLQHPQDVQHNILVVCWLLNHLILFLWYIEYLPAIFATKQAAQSGYLRSQGLAELKLMCIRFLLFEVFDLFFVQLGQLAHDSLGQDLVQLLIASIGEHFIVLFLVSGLLVGHEKVGGPRRLVGHVCDDVQDWNVPLMFHVTEGGNLYDILGELLVQEELNVLQVVVHAHGDELDDCVVVTVVSDHCRAAPWSTRLLDKTLLAIGPQPHRETGLFT